MEGYLIQQARRKGSIVKNLTKKLYYNIYTQIIFR